MAEFEFYSFLLGFNAGVLIMTLFWPVKSPTDQRSPLILILASAMFFAVALKFGLDGKIIISAIGAIAGAIPIIVMLRQKMAGQLQ